jgi:pimeloyl-ACP methyl ester carboxylesterase
VNAPASGLVNARVLRRAAPVQVVLLHGLFCNGGFWLPWLDRFPGMQVTVASIDYGALFATGADLDVLGAEVDRIVGAKPAHLVAHSFGCWAGMFARRGFLSRSFVCPTFAADDVDPHAFGAEIARRTGGDGAAIALQVAQAIGVKERHADGLRWRAGDDVYLAHDDPYFRYTGGGIGGRVHACAGGHFGIGEAVTAIARGITLR